MARPMRTIASASVAATGFLAAALTAQSQSTRLDAALSLKVDSIATQVLRSTGVPSASVAVVTNAQLAYAKAYGLAKLEPQVAAAPDMRYAIGSISKQFTAAALLLLQQDGKLSMDDPVAHFIPGLTRGNEVTIRQLLSHTSGYQDFWPQDYVMPMMFKPATPQSIADRWGKQPLDFDPGTRWQYSNTNYTLAGMVVEKAGGMPFFEFVRTRILDPVGLKSASDFDASPRAANATGYLRYALGPPRPAPDAASGWMWAAGELAMTASDLAKWDISMIRRSLLAPKSYSELETEVRLRNGSGTGYGLGVGVTMQGGRFRIEHNGEVSGFSAENMVFPDDSVAIVVLVNQDAVDAAPEIARQVAASLFATDGALAQRTTAQARAVFVGLQAGKIDRSLLTSNASAYFSDQALKDFASSLGPLGAPIGFVQTGTQKRGGMVLRNYRVTFPNRTLRVWTYETPDGKLEQYQVAPQG
jgi:D-alanyl-D-alanine carboxypeptidase